MKKHAYLVSYNFQKEGYIGMSSGTSQVYRDKKIKAFNDINDLVQFLEKRIDGASNLAIYNFIYLGKHRVNNKEN